MGDKVYWNHDEKKLLIEAVVNEMISNPIGRTRDWFDTAQKKVLHSDRRRKLGEWHVKRCGWLEAGLKSRFDAMQSSESSRDDRVLISDLWEDDPADNDQVDIPDEGLPE